MCESKKCVDCIGTCCMGWMVGKVYITQKEFKNLENNSICLTGKVEYSDIDRFAYKIKFIDGKCIFYRKNYFGKHCSIYRFRPQVCRNYSTKKCRMKKNENKSQV